MSVLIFFGWGGAVLAVRTLPSLCMGRCSCFAHCPRLCGVERLFRGFAHMQLRAAPRSRARCSCCCARPRVRRARCPRVRCAYIPRRPTRGKCIRLASLGMSRLAVHAPFALRVRFAAARVVELVGASHEGDTHSPVAASVLWAKRRHRRWATSPRRCICPPRRLRAASSRPRLHRPVHITAETAGSCRLPQKTWRCDGVSLNCRCSAVLF